MNVAQQINAVLRRIAHGDGEHTVALEQTFATTADDLWHACTDPERLARWFEPVEGDLVEGGRYKLTGSGTEGTIGRCEPPHALRITWEYGGDVSSVEVDLTPADEGTTLTLRHIVPDNEHWTTYGPAAPGLGWDDALLALSLLLAGDDRADPEALAAFAETDEDREFMDRAARSWQDAHVAAGTATSEAEAQAARTVAAYRGE